MVIDELDGKTIDRFIKNLHQIGKILERIENFKEKLNVYFEILPSIKAT